MATTSTPALLYSSDAIAWTESDNGSTIFTGGANCVAFNGIIFVAGGQGDNQLAYSTDGITWTASTSGNALMTTACSSIAWGNDKWVAVGSGTDWVDVRILGPSPYASGVAAIKSNGTLCSNFGRR